MSASDAYYFAARYSRHAEMREYREQLTQAIPGASVTSQWIDCHDGHPRPRRGFGQNATRVYHRKDGQAP